MNIGDRTVFTRVITDHDVRVFADLSGDHNPVHLDEKFAAKTRFGRRIVHGALVTSLISAVLGTTLPGPGTIYLGQSVRFLLPVFVGDTVAVEVEVREKKEDKPIYLLRTDCRNEQGDLVVTGEATVMYKS